MTKRVKLILFAMLTFASAVRAQIEMRTEAQATVAGGDHNPLWLNANRYGLSSIDKTNGYVRAGVFRSLNLDSTRKWAWGAGVDAAVAGGFTSTLVVQQAYGELRWQKGLLTIGSKEQPMELKNQELSSGSQTLGINARPVPGVRLSLPCYWDIPFAHGWIGLKGHIFYGMTTDDAWQEDFSKGRSRYTEHAKLHTKAGYLRIGKAGKPLTVEMGLEMACQYGGKSHQVQGFGTIKNKDGLKGMFEAFIPGGGEPVETTYRNMSGNHLGSWVARANLDYDAWGVSLYGDHFFEDQSSMFLLDYDGYGSGPEWNEWKKSRWFVYDLKDMLVGIDIRLKRCPWLSNVVAEYVYTKYQSGPLYHDHTQTMSDHVSGIDEYYNHHLYTGWQHWGQVMGNPLYRSPLYNTNHDIYVADARFWAWHLGVAGTPVSGLHYRALCSWQKGFGTYKQPFIDPQRNLSLLAETSYSFSEASKLDGWSVKGALGYDQGGLLGDNIGFQLTIGKRLVLK